MCRGIYSRRPQGSLLVEMAMRSGAMPPKSSRPKQNYPSSRRSVLCLSQKLAHSFAVFSWTFLFPRRSPDTGSNIHLDSCLPALLELLSPLNCSSSLLSPKRNGARPSKLKVETHERLDRVSNCPLLSLLLPSRSPSEDLHFRPICSAIMAAQSSRLASQQILISGLHKPSLVPMYVTCNW